MLKVPTSALVRAGDQWAVYAVKDGRAVRALTTLGHQNGQEAEVTAGIADGVNVAATASPSAR